MNKTIRILIIALVVILVLSFAKDAIIKTSVEKGAEVVTGLRLSIQSLRVGILNTLVGIKNLKLYNPKGFKDPLMLNMPEIYVDYDLPAIIRGKIHLPEVRINMQEFVVVKNADGKLNLDALNVVKEQKGEKPAKPAEKGKAPEIQIDELQLTIGKVIYKDYSKGGEPQVQEFNIALNEKYQNIDDPTKLVSLIVVKALMNTSIARLTNFDLNGLQGTIGDTLQSAQKVVGQATEAAGKVTQQAQEAAKETTKAVEEATKGIKDLFGTKE
jgi:hypothetical protein